MDFGEDIYLDENRDINFTPAGDVQLVSGVSLVCQDLREHLSIVKGSINWDKNAGSDLILALNSSKDLDLTIINEIERVALEDKRILATSISVEKVKDNNFKLSFQVVESMESGELFFDLKELLNG